MWSEANDQFLLPSWASHGKSPVLHTPHELWTPCSHLIHHREKPGTCGAGAQLEKRDFSMAKLKEFWQQLRTLSHEQGILHVSKIGLKNCTIRKGQWNPDKPLSSHEFYGSYGYGNQLRLGQLVNNALLLPLHVSKEGGLTWSAVPPTWNPVARHGFKYVRVGLSLDKAPHLSILQSAWQ